MAARYLYNWNTSRIRPKISTQ